MMQFDLCCASHSDAILNANLMASPLVLAGHPVDIERNSSSASAAYNRLLDRTSAPVVVFAHHDVWLPQGWEELLAARISELPENWALFGAFGVGLDAAHVGPVWSSSLGMIVGRVPLTPQPVESFDELLIVMRRDRGLRFDEGLPGWHLYGTDIVTQARARGFGASAGGLPCLHNDRYHEALDATFTNAYKYLQRKWAARLPLRTPITKISRSGLHLIRDNWKNRQTAPIREGMATGTETAPADLAARCGWSSVWP
ncbi:MAG: hypothetical protein ACRC14_16700 [Paracoccaceae bacterium]